MTETKRNYKSTLNLPRTDFAMRANLAQNEAGTIDRWEKQGHYDRAMSGRADGQAFVFHDGPPYANGSLHEGHMLNKVLKDFVVRSHLLEGHYCRFVPGWDCHGLPIEHRVLSDLNQKGKLEKIESLDPDARRMAIRRECGGYASKTIKSQIKQLKSLLTIADYDHPYITMDPAYEKGVLEVFISLLREGLVYRDKKPVHWSIENRTALAEAELEYQDREDRSVFVDFESVDRDAVAAAFSADLEMNPSFMIWTTTPWTLPANLAVAVGEQYRYALVMFDGSLTIVASELLPRVAQTAGAEFEIIAETEGANLVGLEYRHPFCDRTGRILAADYVTMEDGTGLVHTAPGHGQEDYMTGLKSGLEIYCPVREDGTYDETVPQWIQGRSIWEGNDLVTETLRSSGHLVHDQLFSHSYPHDWRSKTPVIFRCAEQWFIAVDKPRQSDQRNLRQMAIEASSSRTRFEPEWGRNRMLGMLESRPDWCISRQRAWGLPIPAFQMPDGTILMTAASVATVAECIGREGSDAWFTKDPASLLEGYDPAADQDAPEGIRLDQLAKMYDIFDVWFESGSSWNAVMRGRDLGYPVDLYLEGSDQHRGWFQASMLPALGAMGDTPFGCLLTHGFIVDKDGKKMSKSIGNALGLDQMIKDFGADVCRWWVGSISYDNDIKLDVEFLKVAGESYRKVRNTLRFLLSNIGEFQEADCIPLESIEPTSIDAWVLQQAVAVQQEVRQQLDQYDFRRAQQSIFDFCNETLSSIYCAAVKDRLYCDAVDSDRRRRTCTTMHEVVHVLIRLLAPMIPHTAEEAWRSFTSDQDAFVIDLVHRDVTPIDADPHWATVMDLREQCLKQLEQAKADGIENPLDAGLEIPDPDGVLAPFAEDLADLMGVSRITLSAQADSVSVIDLSDQPRCERSWKRDGTVRERSDGGLLSDRDAVAVGLE